MEYTLNQLKLADELAFPADMNRLCKQYFPDLDFSWYYMYRRWDKECGQSVVRLILSFSRADLDRGLREPFEGILNSLLGLDKAVEVRNPGQP